MDPERDKRYLDLLLKAIRVCADYKPKLGKGSQAGLSLQDFQALYHSDPFYSWFGLDHPLMYAAHKAAGGMTSIYRQIGIGCEELFRTVTQDELGLSSEASAWSYIITGANQKERKLSLDCRIALSDIKHTPKRKKVASWIQAAANDLQIEKSIAKNLRGAVFEVRQGYKSKDSKRQNADISNAAIAYTQAYLPCGAVFSSQIDNDVLVRYRNEKWLILTGQVIEASSITSTYFFMKDIVGYDLAGFFTRNTETLQREINLVLEAILNAR
jgi:hypothetical protein